MWKKLYLELLLFMFYMIFYRIIFSLYVMHLSIIDIYIYTNISGGASNKYMGGPIEEEQNKFRLLLKGPQDPSKVPFPSLATPSVRPASWS
jgi:hypothetical protein